MHHCRLSLVVLFAAVALPISARAIDDDADWRLLAHITHRKTLTFWLSSKVCVEGKISKLTDHAIEVEPATLPRITLQRKDVLRVGDSRRNDYDILYSARNSWLDVEKLHGVHGHKESVRVTTRNGAKHEGEVASVNGNEIVVKTGNKPADVAKIERSNVALVEYIRFKPASDNATFWMDDGVFLTPETWVYYIGLGPKMTVRIYDASKPEDNRPFACKGDLQ